MSDVAAIVLAAGRGSRFGNEPKLLSRLAGKALVRHVAEAATESLADPVIVVTGHRADEIQAMLHGLPVQVAYNPLFGHGISSSLKAGFSALPLYARAAIVLLGDMPLVTPDLIDSLVKGWRELGEPAALVPTVNGQRGNPVVLSRRLEPAIGDLSGDAGAGPILRGRSDVVEFPVANRAILQDVDVPQDLGDLSSD